MVNNNLVGGFSPYPSEKWWSEFVSWDDDIPNIWKKHVPNHQPDSYVRCWMFNISLKGWNVRFLWANPAEQSQTLGCTLVLLVCLWPIQFSFVFTIFDGLNPCFLPFSWCFSSLFPPFWMVFPCFSMTLRHFAGENSYFSPCFLAPKLPSFPRARGHPPRPRTKVVCDPKAPNLHDVRHLRWCSSLKTGWFC